jgi:hypothetical protein
MPIVAAEFVAVFGLWRTLLIIDRLSQARAIQYRRRT